jgi:hypothetical protein
MPSPLRVGTNDESGTCATRLAAATGGEVDV